MLLRFDGAALLLEPADEVTLVVHNEAGDELRRQRMAWIVAGYFVLLRKPPADATTLTAEVVIDGVALRTSHPL